MLRSRHSKTMETMFFKTIFKNEGCGDREMKERKEKRCREKRGRERKKEENIQCETNMNEEYINPCPFLIVDKGSISFIYSTIIIKNQGWRYCLNVIC